MTLTAVISETKAGNPLLSFLGTVLNDEAVKSAASDNAKVMLLPAARQQANTAAAIESQNAAADQIDTSFADAVTKLELCHGAGADLNKAAEARAALRAYLAASAAMPAHPAKIDGAAIDILDLTSPETIAQSCSQLFERLTGKVL
nr:hypothetical protein [Rhizobium leguminosarum]